MKLQFVAATCLAALSLAGCDGASKASSDLVPSDEKLSSDMALTAVLSCTVNGTPLGVAACFTGDSTSPDGSLKITNGGEVKQYSLADIYSEMNQPYVRLELSEPFSIQAQSNGDSGYVLRVELRNGNEVVLQDEVASFGVISMSNDDLGY